MLLNKIIKEGLVSLSKLNDVSYRVDNIILGKSLYTMKNCNRIFSDMNVCLILLEQGYGFTYFQENIDFKSAEKYVNKDIREVLKDNTPLYIKVALADAIYSVINNLKQEHKYKYLRGDLRTKASKRAKELLKEIPKHSKVVLLGAVTEIIEECSKRKIQLSVLDIEPSKIGLVFSEKTVENSDMVFREKIRDADYVIATGMIFVSKTADLVFQHAKNHLYKLILYMETGSNFGGILIEYGAYKVLSEFFPYYDFNGETRYLIHRRRLFSDLSLEPAAQLRV